MRILIAGCGRIGRALIDAFSDPIYDVTVIEEEQKVLDDIQYDYDVLAYQGKATDYELLCNIGIEKYDIAIEATDSDEANVLAGLIAKEKGVRWVAARVGDLTYSEDFTAYAENKLGIDYVFNPSSITADRIFHKMCQDEGAMDKKSAVIVGGGETAICLANKLVENKHKVKILGRNESQCLHVCNRVNKKVKVINAGEEMKKALETDGLENIGAFAAVSDNDELNILLAIYADSMGVSYTTARATQREFILIGKSNGVDEMVSPIMITDYILSHCDIL